MGFNSGFKGLMSSFHFIYYCFQGCTQILKLATCEANDQHKIRPSPPHTHTLTHSHTHTQPPYSCAPNSQIHPALFCPYNKNKDANPPGEPLNPASDGTLESVQIWRTNLVLSVPA